MTSEAILREFMQRRLEAKAQGRIWLGHKDATIKTVKFDEYRDDGWSEYTPGEGWVMVVECYDEAGDQVYVENHAEHYTIEFIQELCRFAAENMRLTTKEER